ncbi:Mur ligase family protein [Halarcobacter bivalviorum]|uniref:UDP-N-acetylmuramyl pentapeptide synthase n=1 Tax=Halarcobacter bivalviorum TaxID=663364 RepID=A0AAX2A6X1_9BACT|nr:Mur ligase family protein [Halarcobacter bivalviorum]AXH13392.1 UDP-N-acetylmuramyl pentapeptide synthase [Halarcobacter bivalviorum]RXK10007.1 hypothetical protein CRV05_06405 [Halarcobacter bivalviorum]
MEQLFFTPKEIAEIVDGYWENYDDNLKINEFHHTYHYLKEGNAFVVISDNWHNPKAYRNNENKITRAIKKGVSALIVKNDLEINTKIPILRVENTYQALKKLAEFASLKTEAKKVLITGSYGKTGFKSHLYHVIKNQASTYTRLNSANYTASNYCNLASLKKQNKAFLMEIPVANKSKIQRRSKLIKPNIAVLTSIGHEHIERFKTIEKIIENKLSIATSLDENSKFLVNADDKHYSKIQKELSKYKNLTIKTYGTKPSNNAYILYKKFKNFGWDVIAKIENKVVAYRVPFLEEYAPTNSLGVLLCTYHLGFDIHEAANSFYNIENLKSSGVFYKASYKNKSFFLYDQSNRGGIEGYISFFKTLKLISNEEINRKILLTSEFVDYKDGEMQLIDSKYFQTLIKASGLDVLYSVEKFSEHINVLEDKSIWKNHSIDFENIKDEVLDEIKENDLLCVKGIFESNLPAFIEYIKNLEGFKLETIKSTPRMRSKNESLRQLRTLEVNDIKDFKKYINLEKKRAWIYYFPFIYFWSLSSSREILIEKEKDFLNLFLLDKFNRTYPPKLSLYLPTLPLLKEKLNSAFERIFKYKGYKKASIIWLDKEDVSILKEMEKKITFEYKTFDYLYDPSIYENLSGKKFRNLRQDLNSIAKNEKIEFLPYSLEYKKSCLEIFDKWINIQRSKYGRLSDEKYTRNAILYYNLFDNEDLEGYVVLNNKKVVAFGFSGKMSDDIANMFIGKNDFSLPRVQSYLKFKFLQINKDYLLVNDGPGLSKGLDHSKRIFCPVKKHKLYKANLDKR